MQGKYKVAPARQGLMVHLADSLAENEQAKHPGNVVHEYWARPGQRPLAKKAGLRDGTGKGWEDDKQGP